ncbi:MAG: Do family serine endopeptidase [Alphaproteobacteria bacterium]|nr:Do family serine endopeptidase [Alphaproteobacteria bacterium]
MRRLSGLIAGLIVLLAAGPGLARGTPESFADLAEQLMPAVVNIATSQLMQQSDMPEMPQFPEGSPFKEFFEEFFNQQRQRNGEEPTRRATSLGSGFIIDAAGYVVTNNHVIAEADEIKVVLNDDTELKAEVVGRDPKTDLALLKVESEKSLPFVSFGDSDTVRVGDWVLAIGNPFGFGNTVTAGIISARSRDLDAGPYDDFLQTDAPINRGNSGGPLFNLDGKVIGINTAIFSPSGGSVGIGFATPARLAEHVIGQLRQSGRVQRGWLGVRIQSVDEDIAEGFGLSEPTGALVASVTAGGPAEQAGIVAGDVIVSFDGKPIPTMRMLPRVVAETDVGKAVKVEIVRQGERLTFDVTLGEMPADDELAALEAGPEVAPSAPQAVEALGMTLGDLTEEAKAQYGLDPGATGAVVTAVDPNSAAAAAAIAEGDLIMDVQQRRIAVAADVARIVDEAKAGAAKKIVVLVDRAGDRRFVALDADVP